MYIIAKAALSMSLLLASLSPASSEQWQFFETSEQCAAAGANDEGSIFGLRFAKGIPSGAFLISAFNPKWSIPVSSLPLTIETHGSSGTGSFDVVAKVLDRKSLDFGGIPNPDALLGGIIYSDVLLLKEPNGRVLASFSLSGSKDAVMSAMRCQANQ